EDAKNRLGQVLQENGRPVFSSIALRLPTLLRKLEGAALAKEIRSGSELALACFTGVSPGAATRWPARGWVTGDVADLCLVGLSLTIPPPIVARATDSLVDGVRHAAGRMDELSKRYDAALQDIAAAMRQEDGRQTRRMAMTIL